MKKIGVNEIKDGMVLAKPIIGADGKILLAEGEILQASLSNRLQNWGAVIAYIKEHDEDGEPDNTVKKELKLKKLDIIFEHVLKNNHMLTIYNAVRKHIQNET